MSEKDKQTLQKEIIKLEHQVSAIQENIDSMKENLESIKETLRHLKDIAWDRESKKESNKMYKVLEKQKPSTIVKSNIGDVVVDREFMGKEEQKHLDNPKLRGMVTTEEMLSYPKVARNVEPKFDERNKNYTWKVKANDESALRYGSREYKIKGKDTNRLLTAYSETEYNERQDRGEQGQLRQEFNDRDFLRPANGIISQTKDSTKHYTPKELEILEKSKQAIEKMEFRK